VLVAATTLACVLAGCGGAGPEVHPVRGLVAGRRGSPGDPALFRAGAELAGRFSRAYARSAYLRLPPPLPGESAAVAGALRAAAERVPPARRRLRPRLTGVQLSRLGASAIRAKATIADRRDPPFSIGFVLQRRGGRWLITTVSLPD
jgi:hypothetical protein